MEQSVLDLHPSLVYGFGIVVAIMLLLDLGVFNKKTHVVTSKEATIWTIVWISLSMIFSGVVYYVFNNDAGGHELALEKFSQFQAAYWIEKALSVDNLFVFILVFGFFKVPDELQHKVLFWGVLGALIFRAIFIFAGVEIINLTYLPEMSIFGEVVKINVIMTAFGAFLLYAGIKSWGSDNDDEEEDFGDSAGAKIIKKFWNVSDTYDGGKFFTTKEVPVYGDTEYHSNDSSISKQVGTKIIKLATPLLVVVSVIEMTDVIFAVDSIPAIFAISKDPFILYTSNIFAILGLRSLYFLLANFIHMFSKLQYGLAVILSFIGFKMLISPWIHIDSMISLGVVGGVLILAVGASLLFPEQDKEVNN